MYLLLCVSLMKINSTSARAESMAGLSSVHCSEKTPKSPADSHEDSTAVGGLT